MIYHNTMYLFAVFGVRHGVTARRTAFQVPVFCRTRTSTPFAIEQGRFSRPDASKRLQKQTNSVPRCFSSVTDKEDGETKVRSEISSDDIKFMDLAVQNARNGFGHTFPNPAVGCTLVRQDTNEVIGSGFHPRAGMPHAEVFALLEACGRVESGVAAALSVTPLRSSDSTDRDSVLRDVVQDLSNQYGKEGSQEALFGKDAPLQNIPITAYVTLEPCCHYGKTPPCAAALVTASVNRVVVGFRDPNPRVDGGGVHLLREAGIQVDLLADSEEGEEMTRTCAKLISSFVKRITPVVTSSSTREELDGSTVSELRDELRRLGLKVGGNKPELMDRLLLGDGNVQARDLLLAGDERVQTRDKNDYSHVKGVMRSALRGLANQKKADGSLPVFDWSKRAGSVSKEHIQSGDNDVLDEAIDALPFNPTWLEAIDDKLWQDELVLLRLNNAIAKKRGVKRLGERIALELNAHVAQVVGHTALLYRPALPPVLNLHDMVEKQSEPKNE